VLRKALRFLLARRLSIPDAVLIGTVSYYAEGGGPILAGALMVVGILALAVLDRFYGSRGG
jgi:hypothetical protein